MTRYLLIGALAIIVVGGALYLFSGTNKNAGTTTNSSPGLPAAGSTGQSSSGSATGPGTPASTLILPERDTSTSITTNDFIHNGTTIEDPENKGDYYLAGSLGYCLKDGTCPSGAPSNDYHIVYFSKDQSFTIALIKESIGTARLAAEQFLLATLGVSENDLCNLKYYVGTDIYTNSLYAGKNLGFSFCPGATALPK
ncbi:hypothetical protein HY091_00700 [Candidatus Kaiserbacteria bacterium]|nr:hypothetical protein [Candidatus Kaiserbacteria bacterium]